MEMYDSHQDIILVLGCILGQELEVPAPGRPRTSIDLFLGPLRIGLLRHGWFIGIESGLWPIDPG